MTEIYNLKYKLKKQEIIIKEVNETQNKLENNNLLNSNEIRNQRINDKL